MSTFDPHGGPDEFTRMVAEPTKSEQPPEQPRRRAPSVIERAGIAPVAPPRTTKLRRNPLVALIHDGADRAGIVCAVETGISEALAGSDLALVMHRLPSDAAPAHLREFLRRFRPAGVVFLPPLSEREDLTAICNTAQTPSARLGATKGDQGIACDERHAANGLVAWLIKQGHSRIGFIAGPEDSTSAQQRELGYMDAMADHGLDRGPALIVSGDNSFASGIEGARLLLEISPRPTAIVASNDEMAVGVLHAAAQMEVAVPTDLSVTGFDDTPIAARTLPTLTSMHVPWAKLAAEAVRRIIDGGAAPRENFDMELVVRGSVKPSA